MDFKQKTFRKCGSHYSDLRALDGVEVKVGQNFQPPKKVALPVGFHLNDPSDVLSLTYDFTLENEVIARAEELKAKQLREEEEAKEAAKTADDEIVAVPPTVSTCSVSTGSVSAGSVSAGSVSTGHTIFSTVGTDILQPIACTTVGHKRNDSLGKNSLDLSDFEAQDTNPFELVELQTINDLDELKSVLQSGSQPLPAGEIQSAAVAAAKAPITTASSELGPSTVASQPFSYLAGPAPQVSATDQPIKSNINSKLSKSVPDPSSNQLVDISSEDTSEKNGSVVNSRSVSPPNPLTRQLSQPNAIPSMGYGIPAQPFSYLHGAQTNFSSPLPLQSNSVLVDVNSSGPVVPTSLAPSLPPLSSTPTPLTSSTQTTYPMGGASAQPPSNIRLPPLRKPPPIPPRLSNRKNDTSNIDKIGSSSQGATSVITPLPHPEKTEGISASSTQDASGFSEKPQNQSDGELNPSLNHSILKRQPAQRRNKSKMDSSRQHSTPLPPIPNSSAAPPPTLQSNLPDPTPVLTDSERRFVDYIGIMGFPKPRIARAVQRIGEKDREVIDFLVTVEKLSEEGFPEDDVEIALSLYNDNDKKALEFLKLSESFKQLGFEESYIQEALKAADNDRDKALDFLTSISAS